MKQMPKPLPECIQELSTKVVEAAGRLQTDFPSVASRAEQPGTSSAQTDFPSVASRAERPGTSSAVPPFDIHLASQRRRNLCAKIFYEPQLRNKAKDETEPVHRRVFGVLQDCRKYRDNLCSVDQADDSKMDKIIRELEVESQPPCSSKMCRELYKLTKFDM